MGMPTTSFQKGFKFHLPTDDGNTIEMLGVVFQYSLMKKFFKIEDVKAVWNKHGLPEKFLGEISREDSFKRAIKFGRKAAGSKHVRYEEVKNGDEKSYQYFEVMSNGESLEFDLKGNVKWDRANDNVRCDDPLVESIVKERMEFCRQHFTGADLLRYFKQCCKGVGSCPTRANGGSYFISAYGAIIAYTLEKVVKELDPEAWFSLMELPKTMHTKETVKVAYVDNLQSRLKVLRKKWLKFLKEGKKLTSRIFKNGLEDIQQEMGEMEIIADTTGYDLAEAKELTRKNNEALQFLMMRGDNDPLPDWLKQEMDEIEDGDDE